MADCNISMFEYITHGITPLQGDDLREAYEITLEDGLNELLNFLVEKERISEPQSHMLWGAIVMFEDYGGGYWEEDYGKYMDLQDAIGLTREACAELASGKERED